MKCSKIEKRKTNQKCSRVQMKNRILGLKQKLIRLLKDWGFRIYTKALRTLKLKSRPNKY